MIQRCAWASGSEAMQEYHDREWGVPLHEDRGLFEFVCLEGAQAGLSWSTVLNKREHYRQVFADFDIARCARLSDAKLEKILIDPGVIRNRLKVFSVRRNAKAALQAIADFGSLDAFVWSFVEGKPVRNAWVERGEVPAKTAISDTMSKTLQKRDFIFVGSTICYALMQATGMVNDHQKNCFRWRECNRLR
jgi:DNA-3-methyladenine glycosylase I